MVNQVRAQHILVKTEKEAQNLLEELKKGASFERLAQLHSLCPSGKRGGDLGYFGRGQMVRPFELAAFQLDNGQVSEPVKTEFGWHLVKVIDKK